MGDVLPPLAYLLFLWGVITICAVLAVLSGVLLLASGGVWLWTGFNSF
jgi:hypothetical protein